MFIDVPRLPETSATYIVVGEPYANILKNGLDSLSVRTLALPASKRLPQPVCGHCDLLMHHIGGDEIILSPGMEAFGQGLIQLGFKVRNSALEPSAGYENEVGLNVLRVGKAALHNTRLTDPVVRDALKNANVNLLHINQGYSACSTLVISKKSAITADISIYNILTGQGIEVLLISPGYINLPGYNYGFIGGCGGMLSPCELLLTGRLDSHPDCGIINDFLYRHDVKPIYLTDMPCFDVWGIIPVLQE